ncbi:MAG TPA: ABC-F family ATP-binding cassette domain-containing protein [Puia sp.]|nr:ABC-F family ATP-binding cassette domain-containing protein [Puia sp.]
MLVGLQDVTFEFGPRTIVENATWHIQPNDRIGLIGYNGTGKSTLLKLMVGEYLPTAGTVEKSRSTSIGYLHQDLLSFDTGESILTVALGAFERILKLEKEIEILGTTLEKTGDEKILLEYSEKLHELELLGGYNIHHKTEEVLQGLGFSTADLLRPYKEFSGGWRMRVLLAKMILQQPDLLLLDEPTNHLDLPSIEWLEKYLQSYPGAVVIVSHDKYFLNRMVSKIVELYQRELHFYSGNYDFYETEKAQRTAIQQRAFENQQEYIRQQERFIERFRAKATKAAAAQSAIKRLEKLDRVEDVNVERPTIKINFRVDKTPGKTLVTLKSISKQFGEIEIVHRTSAEIDRGDKIALIGANGKGKSTLLRIIGGTETFEGERKWGHNVEASFYAQHQLEALKTDNTVLAEMKEAGSQKSELELRTLLGCFLFSGDEVEKKIKVLSGGEKARVALAKTIIGKSNFLLLDEPTNHLDMHSCDLLVESLDRYEGSFILVSHDRYFISKTANKIWEIENFQIKEFKGTYPEWVEWKSQKQMREIEKNLTQDYQSEKEKPERRSPPGTPADPPTNQKEQNTGRIIIKEQKKELQKLQRIFEQLGEKISSLEKEKRELEIQLGLPSTYADKVKFLKIESLYKETMDQLRSANLEYETAFDKIVRLEQG